MNNTNDEPQQAVPTIWDTLEALAEHPLLQTAISIVLENIEHCLSHSYDIVDSKGAPDHKSVILGLPGSFMLGVLSSVAGQTTPAPHFGIRFSQTIVAHSSEYVRRLIQENPSAIDNLYEDFNVLQFIAVLQQTLEHELGHLKFHADGVKDENGGNDDKIMEFDTPQRLRFEAGYAVQMNIRMHHFQNEVDEGEVVLVDLESEPMVEPVVTTCSYLYPNLMPKTLEEGINQVDQDENPVPLSKEELVNIMDYTRNGGCGGTKKRKRGGNEDYSGGGPDDKPPADSSRDGPDDGGSGDTPRGSSRYPRTWQDSIRHFIPSAVANARVLWQEKAFPSNKFEELGRKKLKRKAGGRVTDERITAFRRCTFDLKLCDRFKRQKSFFTQDEEICVMVTITNTTKASVVVYMTAGKYFGRSGFLVEIENIKRGRVSNSYVHRMVLPSDEEFTAFRTIAKPLTPDGHKHHEVAYVTPPSGEYNAFVSIYGERVGVSVPFSIVAVQQLRSPPIRNET